MCTSQSLACGHSKLLTVVTVITTPELSPSLDCPVSSWSLQAKALPLMDGQCKLQTG